MSKLQPRIIQQYADFSHPLVIPLLMAEMVIDYITAAVFFVDEQLGKIESLTRRKETEAKQRDTSYALATVDYHGVAFDLRDQTAKFARLKAQMETAIDSQQFLLGQVRWMESYKKLDRSSPLLEDRIQYTLDNLKQMLRYNGIEKRLQAHQNYVSKK